MAEISPQAFELSRNGDPAASRTGWIQLTGNGRSYPTHRLLRVKVSRVEFRASMAAQMASLLCLALAVIVLVASMLSTAMVEFRVAGSILGLVLLMVVITMFYYSTAPVVLDKLLGQMRRGRRSSLPLLGNIVVSQSAALADVYAIQLLGKSRDGGGSDTRSIWC